MIVIRSHLKTELRVTKKMVIIHIKVFDFKKLYMKTTIPLKTDSARASLDVRYSSL